MAWEKIILIADMHDANDHADINRDHRGNALVFGPCISPELVKQLVNILYRGRSVTFYQLTEEQVDNGTKKFIRVPGDPAEGNFFVLSYHYAKNFRYIDSVDMTSDGSAIVIKTHVPSEVRDFSPPLATAPPEV